MLLRLPRAALVVLGALVAWSALAAPLTPEEVVAAALARAPELVAAETAVDTARGERRQAATFLENPQVQVGRSVDGELTQAQATRSLSLFGEGHFARRAAGLRVEASEAAALRQRLVTAAEARALYVDAVVARQQAIVARDAYELSKGLRAAVERKLEVGEASELEARLARLGEAQSAASYLCEPPRPPEDAPETAGGGEQRSDRPPKKRKRKQDAKVTPHGRRDLAEVEMEEQVVNAPIGPSCVCPKCKKALKSIGPQVSYRVELVPAHYVKHKIVVEQCVCPDHPEVGVTTGTLPVSYALPRALCGNRLLASVIVDKYADHLPLARQESRFDRAGFHIARATLCDWMMAAGDLMEPIVQQVRLQVRAGARSQGGRHLHSRLVARPGARRVLDPRAAAALAQVRGGQRFEVVQEFTDVETAKRTGRQQFA
jgi:transposase